MERVDNYSNVLGTLLDNPKVYFYGFIWSFANIGWSLLFIHGEEMPMVDVLFLGYLFLSLYGWLKLLSQKKEISHKRQAFQAGYSRKGGKINDWCDCRRHHWISVRMG
jgi:hypothetical protein